MKTENLNEAKGNAETIAKFIGLTARRVAQLAQENRLPSPDAAGLYPLAATVAQYCENLRARADVATITSAKRRKLEAQAGLSEMQLAQKRGELVEVKNVELVWSSHVIAARQVIEQSALTRQEKERLCNELAVLKIEEYLKGQ
jgi:hypothetical protein